MSAETKTVKKRRIGPIRFTILLYCGISAVLTLIHWPHATDGPAVSLAAKTKPAEAYYAAAYRGVANPVESNDEQYVKVAKEAAQNMGVKDMVVIFAHRYRLKQSRVLDVGAGRGYLQDVVENYVGLDISPTARRFFHKPFVQASATDMPFRDDEFDAAWSVWVLEHVPEPEKMLSEMRRVVKPGGLILLAPTWLCSAWAADGYHVRPYSDFGIGGRLVKASVPIQENNAFIAAYLYPTRTIRTIATMFSGPTTLHYRRVTPNYNRYWEPDSDAVNSIDAHEALLWFQSRGDECLNCTPYLTILDTSPVLIIRVKS